MDVFLYYKSVNDIPMYNCSAVTTDGLLRFSTIKRPAHGISVIVVGFPMMLLYIVCLRVMVTLNLVRNPCYKIMFVLGLNEINAVVINDLITGYILISGLTFCDSPDLFYIMGCVNIATWAGSSYFCLYLAFNRVIEVLKFRRQVIDFFFTPIRTVVGILAGFMYSISFFLFTTPAIFSNEIGTPIPNPLGFEMPLSFQMRHTLMVADNCAFVIFTAILYGVFCILLRKKFKKLGFPGRQNNLQHQVFIQSILMSFFNFLVSITYIVFMFVSRGILYAQIGYVIYQVTAGLQALIYLLFNQTIFNGVKNDLKELLGIKLEESTITTMTTVEKTSQYETKTESVLIIQ